MSNGNNGSWQRWAAAMMGRGNDGQQQYCSTAMMVYSNDALQKWSVKPIMRCNNHTVKQGRAVTVTGQNDARLSRTKAIDNGRAWLRTGLEMYSDISRPSAIFAGAARMQQWWSSYTKLSYNQNSVYLFTLVHRLYLSFVNYVMIGNIGNFGLLSSCIYSIFPKYWNFSLASVVKGVMVRVQMSHKTANKKTYLGAVNQLVAVGVFPFPTASNKTYTYK